MRKVVDLSVCIRRMACVIALIVCFQAGAQAQDVVLDGFSDGFTYFVLAVDVPQAERSTPPVTAIGDTRLVYGLTTGGGDATVSVSWGSVYQIANSSNAAITSAVVWDGANPNDSAVDLVNFSPMAFGLQLDLSDQKSFLLTDISIFGSSAESVGEMQISAAGRVSDGS